MYIQYRNILPKKSKRNKRNKNKLMIYIFYLLWSTVYFYFYFSIFDLQRSYDLSSQKFDVSYLEHSLSRTYIFSMVPWVGVRDNNERWLRGVKYFENCARDFLIFSILSGIFLFFYCFSDFYIPAARQTT